MPSDRTVTLVEADDATLASVATDQVENRLLLGVGNNKVGLFLVQKWIHGDFGGGKVSEPLVPVDGHDTALVSDSEHEHDAVLEERAVKVGLVVTVVALVVVDGAEGLVGRNIVSGGVHVVNRNEPVEFTIFSIQVHK